MVQKRDLDCRYQQVVPSIVYLDEALGSKLWYSPILSKFIHVDSLFTNYTR